ncbi:polysaccharide biosynthesis protein [Psychromonas ingrahamii 37]|uniref:Polysaccharide biosynthesis protein n=2 Tax=Psychromonas ingrahamii TaxID=357794 RepID=A1ST10_PSYIN|nr:polysaccharide biosynthesis protein [Psychromonas ingrahamii 37]
MVMGSQVSGARSKRYLKQLKGAFVFKMLALMASFLIIPIMIKYLGAIKYGIWSTLLSILSWVLMFDLGIGNGLRNRISESIAKNDLVSVRKYISTAYVSIGLGAVCIGGLFFIGSEYIPWNRVFNTEIITNKELKFVVNISMFFVLVNFLLSLINQVLNAVQKAEQTIFNQFLSNVLSLTFVYALYLYTESSMEYLAFSYGISIFISNSIFSIWFYKSNPDFTPSFSFVRKNRLVDTLALGLRFFVIQIAVVVLFTTDKLMITQLLGPAYVTSYDVVFKLFTVITIIHGIIVAPLWTSYSDAFHRGDYTWMRTMMNKQLQAFGIIFLGILVLSLISPFVIEIWVGEIPHLDNKLIYFLAVFTFFLTWNNVFAIFLNGINETKLQMRTAIVASVINIPLSVFFVKYFNMGVEGVVLGTILALSIFAFFGPYESYKLLYKVKND